MTAELSTPTDRPPESSSSDTTEAPVRGGQVAAYYELTKPGIAIFVMLSAGVSFFLASGARIAFAPLLHTLFGTGVATAGALALNHFLERESDALMKRTRHRPLPSGRIHPREALIFGVVLSVAGVGHLWYWVGSLPAAITAGSVIAYDFIYTPLKSRSYAATLVGAIPGALPMLIGWSAATGAVTLGALVLFGIGFLWQLPHVLALAWLYREDYEKAGFLMSPPSDPEGKVIGRHIAIYSLTLLPMSLAPTLLGLTGWIYFGGALVLGLIVAGVGIAAAREMTRQRARRVFFLSLLYHPLILGLILINPA